MNPQTTLADLGMDSLMVTEIKQILERNSTGTLTSKDIRNLTFKKLEDITSTLNILGKTASVPGVPRNSTAQSKQQPPYNEVAVLIPSEVTVNPSTNPLFILASTENKVTAVCPLVNKLRCPLWSLQHPQRIPFQSLQDEARFYIQVGSTSIILVNAY